MKNFGNLASISGGDHDSVDRRAASCASRPTDPQDDLSAPAPSRTAAVPALTALNAAALLGFALFALLFYRSISQWWFSPIWTTDDALQQVYPFHKVFDPQLFAADIITRMMEQYLTPLHYGVMWLATYLSGSPIMAGHWTMLLQLMLSVGFIAGAVYSGCGRGCAAIVPACFAAVWFLHTRLIVQRLTAGLPRGWAAPLFAAFLFFAIRKNHKGVLATLLIGCLLHPPATLILAIAYGLWLLGEALISKNRFSLRSPLGVYLVLSPLYLVLAWSVVRMPAEIGSMATLDVAAKMPEFSTPYGRFPFYPLRDVSWEMATFGFQAFLSRLYSPGAIVKETMIPLVLVLCAGLAWCGVRTKREIFPRPTLYFLLATLVVYFLSRALAFRLYVPDRHLQFPLAIFFIVTLSVAVWRAGAALSRRVDGQRLVSWKSVAGLVGLGFLIVIGSGSGLQGSANFNYSAEKKGKVFAWLEAHTARSALIAGEPTLIDGVMLFAKRTAYITTETAHPFYDGYYAVVKPRLERTLRAHYARTLPELLALLEPQGVDYFVFERKKFYPEALAAARYFEPFNGLVRELASRDWREYAFRQLPRTVNLERFPPMPFRDEVAVVVDLKALRQWIDSGKELPNLAEGVQPVREGNLSSGG